MHNSPKHSQLMLSQIVDSWRVRSSAWSVYLMLRFWEFYSKRVHKHSRQCLLQCSVTDADVKCIHTETTHRDTVSTCNSISTGRFTSDFSDIVENLEHEMQMYTCPCIWCRASGLHWDACQAPTRHRDSFCWCRFPYRRLPDAGSQETFAIRRSTAQHVGCHHACHGLGMLPRA